MSTKPTPEYTAAQKMTEKSAAQQGANADAQRRLMQQLVGEGMSYVQGAGGIAEALANPSRGDLSRIYAPQLEDIALQRDATLDLMQQSLPYGGGMSNLMSQAYMQGDQAKANLLRGAPLQAADIWTNLGQLTLGAGSNFGSLSNQAYGNAGSTYAGLMNTELERMRYEQAMWDSLVTGLGGAAGAYAFSWLPKRGK